MIRAFLLLAMVAAGPALAGEVPSRFGVDAPELARLGGFAVGVKTLTLVQPAQPDVLAFDAARGTAPAKDRVLIVDVWYPARAAPGSAPVVYEASLPSPRLSRRRASRYRVWPSAARRPREDAIHWSSSRTGTVALPPQ
jgi:hypothetical protein